MLNLAACFMLNLAALLFFDSVLTLVLVQSAWRTPFKASAVVAPPMLEICFSNGTKLQE